MSLYESTSTAENFVQVTIRFELCNWARDLLFEEYFVGQDCASEEEIIEYFQNTYINVLLITGTNYIDFKDIDDPMKKSTSIIGDEVSITSLH